MHPLGPIVVGRWIYARAACETALQDYGALTAEAPRELTTAFTLTSTGLTVTAFWSGSVENAEETVKRYGALALAKSGMIEGLTFLELQSRNDAHFAWGRRYYAKGGFLKHIDDRAISCLLDCVADAPTPDSELYILQLGGAITDVAEDATAYSGRQAGFYWIAEPVWESLRMTPVALHGDDRRPNVYRRFPRLGTMSTSRGTSERTLRAALTAKRNIGALRNLRRASIRQMFSD